MKDSASYNKLWQAKMQEFPLEGDANSSWQKMLGSLDENMPFTEPVPAASKPWNFIGAKLLIAVLVIVSTIIFIYLAYHFNPYHQQRRLKPGDKVNRQVHNALQPNHKNNLISSNLQDIKRDPDRGSNSVSSRFYKQNAISTLKKTDLNDTKNTNPSIVNYAVKSSLLTGSAAWSSLHKQKHTPWIKHQNTAVKLRSLSNFSSNEISSNRAVNSRSPVSSGNHKLNKTSSGLHIMSTNKVSNKTIDLSVAPTENDANGSANSKDSTLLKNKTANQTPLVINRSDNKPASIVKNKAVDKSKTGSGSRGFELEIKTGFNTNKNTSVVPMLGIAGTYNFNSKFNVGTGANLLSYRLIEGSYSNSNYGYTIAGDSGKVSQQIAGKITVANTAKIYTIDIPVLAGYRISKWLSIKAGPVISFPLKKATINSTLGALTKPVDTLSAYHAIVSTANNTILKNDLNIGLSGMLTLSFERFNINGGYLQSLGPYTLASSLGKTNVSYHSFHLGISFLILQHKNKKKK